MSGMRYRPEIDGLRAVAIIPVLLFHLGFDWIPGGYLGVDVFFVISGYLITSILSREIDAGQFSYTRFWGRRIRRILPALLVVTATTLVAGWWLAFPSDRVDIGRQAVATLLSTANFYFWRVAGDYWGGEAERSPFLHAWSLAVEEQFYLFFPMVLVSIHRLGRRFVVPGLVAFIAASAALFLYGLETRPAATFYLLPTRAWELAVGGLLAAMGQAYSAKSPSSTGAKVAGWCALTAIVASYFLVRDFSLWAVVPVVGTAMVIRHSTEGPLHRVLSHPWLVAIGRVSYSLYLWHWPVIVLSRQLAWQPHPLVLSAVFSGLAILSYYLVEEPFRRQQHVIRRIGVAFSLVLALALAAGMVPGPAIDTSGYETLPEESTAYDLHPHHVFDEKWMQKQPNAIPQPRLAPPDAYRKDGIVIGSGRTPPRVVVLGDSHGLMWAHAIRQACEERSLDVAYYCMGGVPPYIDFTAGRNRRFHQLNATEKEAFDEARVSHIERWKPDVVFVCARWSTINRGEMDPLVDFLCRNAKKVVLVEQPPELVDAARNGVSRLAAHRKVVPRAGVRQYWRTANVERYETGRETMLATAAKSGCCEILPTRDLYSQEDKVCFLDGGAFIYMDDNHLTTLGASLALPRIRESLAPFDSPSTAPEAVQSPARADGDPPP